MSDNNKNISKNKFAIAVCSLIAIILLSVAANWNYILNFNVESKAFVSIGQTDNPYQIAIYYFPSRLHAAEALNFYFSQQGYLVNMIPAATNDALHASRSAPSHLFFNHDEFMQAMGIKDSVEKVLGYPVNAYKFPISQSAPSMMMVFTEAETWQNNITTSAA